MTRVLVVEDEAGLRRALAINLRARRYEVPVAATGAAALSSAASSPPDVVVLDLGLPDMDGTEVIRRAARVDAGADHRALRARRPGRQGRRARRRRGRLRHQAVRDGRAARAAARGAAAHAREHAPPTVSTDDFTVDLAAKRAETAAGAVRLTPTEWHLIEVLIRNEDRLVSQRQLLQEVWGPRYETETNYLRVYMAQLRRKLEPDPQHPRYLITEPGMGYRFSRGAAA
jgi:two-component system KDP operon response regulator KdpE